MPCAVTAGRGLWLVRPPFDAHGNQVAPAFCSEHPVWLDDGTISLFDVSHRPLGLWAFDSVNPNGWEAAANFIQLSSADFLAVQETNTPSGRKQLAAEGACRAAKWALCFAPAFRSEKDGLSSGVAVGARSHIGVARFTPPHDPECAVDPSRFHLCLVGSVCRGGLHFGSIYLVDGVGITHASNLDLLQAIAGILLDLTGPWIVAGDWHCTPADLAQTGWPELVGGVIVAPDAPTCNGKTYDFFVVSKSIAHAVFSVQRDLWRLLRARGVQRTLGGPSSPI